MAAIFTKIPSSVRAGVKPPFGARVNWNHPLSLGLVGVWLFNERGRNLYNLALGGVSSLDSTVYTWAEDSAKFDGSSNGVDTNVMSPFNWENTQPMSCAVGFKPADFDSFHIFCGNGAAPGWSIGTNDGACVLLNYWDSGSGVLSALSPAASVVVNKWYDAIITYNGNMHPTGVVFFINGIKKTTTSSIDTLALSSISTRNLWIGRRGDYAWLLPHYMRYLYIWNRVLSDAEAVSIYANPYQIFWNPMRDIYIVPAVAPAAGVPTHMDYYRRMRER